MSGSSVPTICKICDEHCGLLVTDDGNKVTIRGNPAHPLTKGFICAKGKNFGEVHYAPHRLRSPLLKKKSGWEEISFDDALDLLASQFIRCKREFGPESVIFYKGEALKHFEVAQYMRHLANGFGSPNYVSVGTLCHYAQVLGHSLTYGGKPVPDYEKMGVAVLWGVNPAASSPRAFAELRKAVRQGTKLVVVDPASTRTAMLAHVHLRVRPGSDGFLALALLKQAIEERNLKPTDDMQEGWDALVELVGDLSYGYLLEKSDIAKTEFAEGAAVIFDHLPGWTRVGLGLEHRPGGVQTMRAATCLQSLLDPANKPAHMSATLKPLPGANRYPSMPDPIGAAQYPLFTRGRREAQGMLLPDAILHGDPYPVCAMLIGGGNPMLTFPCVERQGEILRKLDFLAVFDLFMTPTAQLADLIIPGADQLDNLELHDYGRIGRPYLGLMRPVGSSPNGLPTWRLIFELARRFGLDELFPWQDNREALTYRLSGTNVEFGDLWDSPGSTAAYHVDQPAGHLWHTKDGKVHYRSNELDASGHAALPIPQVLELPDGTDEEFPFWLSTGDRVSAYQHGQFRGIASYEKKVPEPILDIHPNAAAKFGIQSGDVVLLSTRHGRIEIRANVSDEVREDSLRMVHGWEQSNANQLTGLDNRDTISGFPWLKALPSKVEKRPNVA